MVVDFPSILTVRNDSEYLYKMANYSLKGRVTNFMGQWLGGTDGLPPAALSWSRGWAFGQAGPVAQLGLQPGLFPERPEPLQVLRRAAALLLLFDFISNEGY